MTPGRRDLALFGTALAVRLAHVAFVRGGPLFRYRLIDSEFYDSIGRRLALGDGFPEGPFFMNVLYGAFLGAVYTVFGTESMGRLAVLGLQAGLGAASVVLLARLGRALGRPGQGTIAAALLALFGPAIFYDGAFLTPTLLLFLTTAALLSAVRNAEGRSRIAAFGLGVLTGLLVLGRANNALLLPVFAVPWLRRRSFGAVLLLLAGTAAVVAPITARNWRETGTFVPVTANGGMALWAGNHPGATGIYSEPSFLSNPVPEREAEDYRLEASRRAGRTLSLVESGRFWERETLRRWRAEPAAALRLAARKLRLYFHATESQTNLSYYFAMDHSPVLAVLRVQLGWFLPFAILGLLLEGRRLALPAAAVAVSLATCLLFYVSSEYRHPVVPALLLLAVAGADRLRSIARRARSGGRDLAVAAGLGALGAALFVLVNVRDPFLERLQSRRVDNLNFGTLAFQAGDMADAERFLRRSITIDPAWEPSRRKLAEVYVRTGRMTEAAEQQRRADALAGRAPDTTEAAMDAAGRLFRAGRFAEAEAVFRRLAAEATAIGSPSSAAAALNNAGLCAMNLARAAAADSLFRAAIAADPTYASPIVHRGRLALARGDSTEAADLARTAIALAPDDGRAIRLLARATGPAEAGEAIEATGAAEAAP